MRKATDQRDAQTISLLWTSLLLFHGGDVTCFDACHVIWCGGHVIWCDVIACVVSCHVMQCDVMWCALMWCALQWSRCVFEVVLWRCGDPKYYSVLQSTTVYYKVLLQYYSVLPSTTPVLLCTTQYYNVLLQYYTVLQSTTPVLLCTTKYYSSTTLYYTVLLQYYSVLQSTTPVLVCTKVLLQYYSVLQSTTPVLLCTSQYYNVLLQDYSVLQSTAPVQLCITKQHSWLILDTYEPSFTLRGATGVTLQLHQILRLPRKLTLMIVAPHIWNVIYNARSNTGFHPTSPNTAPATKSLSSRCQRKLSELLPPIERRFEDNPRIIRPWSEDDPRMIRPWNRHLAPAASETLLVPSWRRILYGKIQHFALRLSPKMSRNAVPATKSHTPTSANTAPATQNESHDWSASHMKRHLECAEQAKSTSNLTKYCACHAKSISWLIRVTYETSFRMRGASNVNLEPQQILRLPRKMNLMIDPRLIWNVISNARSKQCQPPTSANTAPATQNESHD